MSFSINVLIFVNLIIYVLLSQQRGRLKEEQFVKKVTEMLMEEEKKRNPIAQGLPLTTDEPEVTLLFLSIFEVISIK